MSQRRIWIGLGAATLLTVSGLGTLIYLEREGIQAAQDSVVALEGQIGVARKTIEGTPKLEHEVIVLREVAAVIDQILPNTEDLNTLVEQFHEYATESEVRVTDVKLKQDRSSARGTKADFDKVGYTLTLESGAFEFLGFLNRIETHSRFMAVPSFKITSSPRQQINRTGEARHKVQVDVETYTYARKSQLEPMRIEGYARKRDLLTGEINRRRRALTLTSFLYKGDRGRRDPWIDPRVPAMGEDGGPTVAEQLEKVDELSQLMGRAAAHWDEVQRAKNILDRMIKKDELEELLATVDEELRRVEADGYVSYVPAQKRLELEVYEPRESLRRAMEDETQLGPRPAEMEQLAASMTRHIEVGEYELALQAFTTMKPALDLVAGDPVREALADNLRALALEAETLRDFAAIELSFGGSVFIGDAPPVIVINDRSRTIGDEVIPGLEIAAIRENEVDFYFRGFVLTRVY